MVDMRVAGYTPGTVEYNALIASCINNDPPLHTKAYEVYKGMRKAGIRCACEREREREAGRQAGREVTVIKLPLDLIYSILSTYALGALSRRAYVPPCCRARISACSVICLLTSRFHPHSSRLFYRYSFPPVLLPSTTHHAPLSLPTAATCEPTTW